MTNFGILKGLIKGINWILIRGIINKKIFENFKDQSLMMLFTFGIRISKISGNVPDAFENPTPIASRFLFPSTVLLTRFPVFKSNTVQALLSYFIFRAFIFGYFHRSFSICFSKPKIYFIDRCFTVRESIFTFYKLLYFSFLT